MQDMQAGRVMGSLDDLLVALLVRTFSHFSQPVNWLFSDSPCSYAPVIFAGRDSARSLCHRRPSARDQANVRRGEGRGGEGGGLRPKILCTKNGPTRFSRL